MLTWGAADCLESGVQRSLQGISGKKKLDVPRGGLSLSAALILGKKNNSRNFLLSAGTYFYKMLQNFHWLIE